MDKLGLEYLQKITYERSKAWSTFFESYENDESISKLEDLQDDIDITNVDKVFSSQVEDSLSDDLLSMEDEDYYDNVKSEFLKNASNTTQFSFLFGNTALDLSAITQNDEEKQYMDVINKTLPVLNEHKRQLQEYGFDKLLISFKKDEIEQKYGRWLNRHNSLFGRDNTLLFDEKTNNFETEDELVRYEKPKRGKLNAVKEIDDDSNDSLQSGETARYIRSSRVGSVKNSTTTMIKTYRMVKRTREALREKYACESDEDDYHWNALRVRNKLGNLQYRNPCMTPFVGQMKNERAAFTSRTQRRKVLRKRINGNICNVDYSSSDSESYENYRKSHRRNYKLCCNKCNHHAPNFYDTPLRALNRNKKILKARSAMKMSSALRNRMYYFSHSMSSPSTPSTSFETAVAKRRNMKRKAILSVDDRPHKRESECYCVNDKKLCKQYNHVADTSTEEWYVDNGCAQLKNQLEPPMTVPAKKQLMEPPMTAPHKKQLMEPPMTEIPMTRQKAKKSQQLESCQKKMVKEVTPIKLNKDKSKTNLKKTNSKTKTLEPIASESPDTELELAIKASKELYEKTKKKIKQKTSTQNDHKSKTAKLNRKLFKIEETVTKETAQKNKLLPQKANSVTKKSKAIFDLTSSPRNSTKEETFFACAKSKGICNSTALSLKGQAYQRQFADKQQMIIEDGDDDTERSAENTVIEIAQSERKAKSTGTKRNSTRIIKDNGNVKNGPATSVTSTTLRSPELHLSLTLSKAEVSKQIEMEDGNKCEYQSDSAHVTSTTNAEITANDKEKEKMPSKNRLLNVHENSTRKCVLIYDPDNRSTVSANCFTDDGYFTVTQEHLGNVIGEKAARKFLKHHVGKMRFKIDSKVYYKPSNNMRLSLNISSSSESDDVLGGLGQYGDLYAISK